MESKTRFLMVTMICAVIFICSSCANRNCSLIRIATEQAENTDQQLKEAAIEQINDSLKSIVITTISWGDYAVSFLSEEVEIEERRVILYGVDSQLGGEWPNIDWALPMSADIMTICLPMGKDCFVHINGMDLLFPREIE